MRFTQSYVVTDVETAIIAEKARLMGNSSSSAAFRAILREWLGLTNPQDYQRRYGRHFQTPTNGFTEIQAPG